MCSIFSYLYLSCFDIDQQIGVIDSADFFAVRFLDRYIGLYPNGDPITDSPFPAKDIGADLVNIQGITDVTKQTFIGTVRIADIILAALFVVTWYPIPGFRFLHIADIP